jgi:Mce-associated membrane protein
VADDRDAVDGEWAVPQADESKARAIDPEDGQTAADREAADDERGSPLGDESEAQPADPCDERTVDDGDAAKSPRSGVRLAMVFGLVSVLALTGAGGWLGWRAYHAHQAQVQRNVFLQTGRQAALNLTTIDYNRAEADVQRILDSATGTFYDDFQRRSPAFVNVVQQGRSKSEGAITAAGLESEQGDQAQVLVAVTVKSSNAAAADQPPRAWRMRIQVQRVGEGAKVSNVEFVP